MTEIVAASALRSVRYSYRAAYGANAFHQFQLVGPSKLGREARDRDLGCSAFESTLVKQLERLDREGAFSPVLFEMVDENGNDAVVFRDEVEYRPWSEYDIDDGVTVKPRPLYSPWQLLYFGIAIAMPKTEVDALWLLDDERRQTIHEASRVYWTARVNTWRGLERDWRNIVLVLVRLSSHYGPPIKGTLMKSTVSLVHHPRPASSSTRASSSRRSTRRRSSTSSV